MPRRLHLPLLALLLLLVLLVQPSASLLGRKKDKQKKERKKEEAAEAEATTTTSTTGHWTRSQQQHQRPGRRRLNKMLTDGKEDVLGLLLDPVELPLLEEANDRVMQGEPKKKSGFFHRRVAADAFFPPESAFWRKEREAGEVGGESGGLGANGSGASDEHGAFHHRIAKRRQQRGQMGIDV